METRFVIWKVLLKLNIYIYVYNIYTHICDFPDATVVKNPPAKAGDVRDASLISGSGRSLEEKMATYSSILA